MAAEVTRKVEERLGKAAEEQAEEVDREERGARRHDEELLKPTYSGTSAKTVARP